MNRSTWKQAERRVAAMLGGRRIPVSGLDRHGADVVTPTFCVQVKRGRRFPSYFKDWLGGICGTAQAAGKIGIVVWNDKGSRDSEAVVLMRLADFQDLCGTLRADLSVRADQA